MTTTTTFNDCKTGFFRVSVPAVAGVPAATIHVPVATDKADAMSKALDLHRERHNIPASVSIMPKVVSVPLVVGTTIKSASASAIWKGRVVS